MTGLIASVLLHLEYTHYFSIFYDDYIKQIHQKIALSYSISSNEPYMNPEIIKLEKLQKLTIIKIIINCLL